jgi:15-cis-phytoene synthase
MSAAVQPVPLPYAPTESQLAMAYSVCRGIARASAKNFYYAFLVLPRRKREALCAVYAFMRRCDDLSDDATLPPWERRSRLESWLDAFHHAQAGEPTDDPILLALTDAQRCYQIPGELLDQLAFGTLMDLPDDGPQAYQDPQTQTASTDPTVQYRSFKDLYLYCYHVASVVGLVCIKIFGYRDPAAERLAERCGIAFQLTNIIRDVKTRPWDAFTFLSRICTSSSSYRAILSILPIPLVCVPCWPWRPIAHAISTSPDMN